jgi:Co/Zn/Cd efflux system component
LVAAGLVAWFESFWPDLIVGTAIAILFLRTAAIVLRESLAELSRIRGALIEAGGRRHLR